MQTLADSDPAHRDARLIVYSDDDSALRGAIELGERHTRDAHALAKLLGLREGVLTGGRIHDQQHLVRRTVDLLAEQGRLSEWGPFDF